MQLGGESSLTAALQSFCWHDGGHFYSHLLAKASHLDIQLWEGAEAQFPMYVKREANDNILSNT